MSQISINRYILKYKSRIIIGALFNLMYSVFTLVSIPLIIPFFQILFDRTADLQAGSSALEVWLHKVFSDLVIHYDKEGALLIVCTLFVASILLRNIFRYLSLYVMVPLRNGVVYDIRKNLYAKILRLPIGYFTEEKKGDLIARGVNDVQEVEWSILNFVEAVFRSPILLIGALSIMIFISLEMTVLVILLVVITLVVLRYFASSLRQKSGKTQGLLGSLSSLLDEAIGGGRVIRTYNAQQYAEEKFDRVNRSFYTSINRTLRNKDLSAPLSETLGMMIVGLLMYIGARKVFALSLNPESFFAFLFAFYQVIEPAKALANSYFNIQKGMAAVDRINGIMSVTDDVAHEGQNLNWTGLREAVRFENVGFSYGIRESFRLQHIDLTINRGQKVALIGHSGSGKSTLAHLLARFYQADEGRIRVDGLDLKDIALEDWRRKVSFVGQESILFNDTVRFNLTLGNPQFTDEEVAAALHSAFASDFVEGLTQGIHTELGDNGLRLSGGQRQRISIARAILHNPDILIFDEATSALDTESEKRVQESVDALMKGKTALIIAHRLSTVINADRIVLLHEGRQIATGRHDELFEKHDLYRNLIKNQVIT